MQQILKVFIVILAFIFAVIALPIQKRCFPCHPRNCGSLLSDKCPVKSCRNGKLCYY
ncbi:hypothetical protein RhiirA1_26214 [Rhizophagus irregularis]|uniref:Uncharacterized protein n=1 Tax=Rhizophagus irregularis TaxID=588596 RepID=A0A2N0SAJ2_9GLOM|nr:hypothetical protein RhiirA1_26214 [Rhizophagus irregularis]GET51957.1 hypothetical protein RIR_e7999_A0A2N0SAJ2_9GLOM [Rhizophagus irregularis DAOM 181602=DAOM 197198]